MANIYVKSQQAGEGTPNTGTYRGIWQASTTWAVGDRVVGVTTVNYYVMECTTGGAGGGTEPTWSTTPGNTTADGAATFTTRLPSTWANATIDLTRAAVNDAAGDFIYVSDTHSETTAGAVTLNWAGSRASPTRVLCVDDASGEPPTTLATTAVVATTGANNLTPVSAGTVYLYGIRFKAGDSTNAADVVLSGNGHNVYENCAFELAGNNTGSDFTHPTATETVLFNCTFKVANAGSAINPNGGLLKIIGCSIEGGGTAPDPWISSITNAVTVTVSGCDLSNLGSAVNISSFTGEAGSLRVINCKMPASWSGSINSGALGVGSITELHNTDSADTNYRIERKTTFGTITSETTIVRTGGASNGTTSLAWKLVTNADAEWSHQTLNTTEIVQWNETTGSAITATIEIVHDSVTALTDREIWVEVQYLGTSGFPLSLFIDDAAANYLSSAANQTTSSETWTTTGMTNPNKQKLAVTFTPQEKGFIHAVVKMAKASYTAYVDPMIVIT